MKDDTKDNEFVTNNSSEMPSDFSNEELAIDIAKKKTGDFGNDLKKLFQRYTTTSKSKEKPSHRITFDTPHQLKNRLLLQLLKTLPFILILLFITSLFWDFNGMKMTLLGKMYELGGLLRILSISGLIGFSTNWVAIKMLFKPAHKRPILGQGLIPAQKERIAYRLASGISRDLINPELIKQKIHDSQIISRYRRHSTRYIKNIIDDPAFRNDLKRLLHTYIEEMIADPAIRSSLAAAIVRHIEKSLRSASLERIAYKTYMLMKGKEAQKIVEEALEKLPDSVEAGLDKVDQLLDSLPRKLEEHSGTIEDQTTRIIYRLINQIDIQKFVEQNIKKLDEKKLESLIKGSTNEQLHYIQYLGALFGTIGGFIIWSPLLSILLLLLLCSVIVLLDIILFRMKTSVTTKS